MTATAVVDHPAVDLSSGDDPDSAVVQIPPEALPALLDQAEVPAPLRDRIGDRIRQGDLTWSAGRDGLVVRVPPSRATTARSPRAIRTYIVGESSCTCRGFYARGGCYHPWLWAVIHAWLHPPVFTVTGTTQLTVERALVVAALTFVHRLAVGEIVLWFVGNQLDLEFCTAAGSDGQISLVCRGSALEATVRGPVAALQQLIRCPGNTPQVTLLADGDGLRWDGEETA